MIISLIPVNRQHRDCADQLQALSQHIIDMNIICHVIIAVKGENSSLEGIHHIVARRLHNDVPHKVRRQRTIACQQLLERFQFFLLRKSSENQQISCLFISEPSLSRKSFYQILDIVASVTQLTFAGNRLAIHNFTGSNRGNVCQTCQNSLTVDIPQTSKYVIRVI